jgi:succinate dehydrogenase / fumarate reductase flavoprotein subunit/L-aspartate oxidase
MHADGIPYAEALRAYDPTREPAAPADELATGELLRRYHPDYLSESMVALRIGPNKGDRCHRRLAELLQANAIIDEAELAGAPVTETDVLVVGGGGAGCAAALTAVQGGARVLLATKLRLGDSNTVMAEGGIQASVEKGDTPQRHFDDIMRGGHGSSDPHLVKQLVMDGPDVIRWLIHQGMQFDVNEFGDLLTRKAGGASAARVVYCCDYTGLEMMRALRETVCNRRDIRVWENSPVVELLSNDQGHCAGAVVYSPDRASFSIIKAQAVILTTGGMGRLHLNGFPTSNHFGATADGLVLAYRMGARLMELDSFQYHPSGLAYPTHLAGYLVTEGLRSAGANLLNGLGERFVDELKPRDYVAAAMLRECDEGRGVRVDADTVGIWLDTPALERKRPGLLAGRFPKLLQTVAKGNVDPTREPLLIYPTLHYHNGGVAIDDHGATGVPGLFCAGEAAGGIHGRNRLMGNALLDIICFGRRAGSKAAEVCHGRGHKTVGLEHVNRLRRELTEADLPRDVKSPMLFPSYANFRIG